MNLRRIAPWAPAACLVAACVGAAVTTAVAQSPATAPVQARITAYLAPDAEPDMLSILPPPPAPGSAREAGDRAVFAETRKLAGQPRWSLAGGDANLAQATDMFSCALGAKLDDASAPALSRVFRKVGLDIAAVIDRPKDRYARPRPYTTPGALSAPVCVPKTDSLTHNPSYPSGHAAVSWTWGLILAELAPDRASQILGRARSIGESRVVCGVHYASDIEAGRVVGASLLAALHGDSAFRKDMDKARAELAALRAGAHATPANCAVQDEASVHAPF